MPNNNEQKYRDMTHELDTKTIVTENKKKISRRINKFNFFLREFYLLFFVIIFGCVC